MQPYYSMPNPSAPPPSPRSDADDDMDIDSPRISQKIDSKDTTETRGRSVIIVKRSHSPSASPQAAKRMRYDPEFLTTKIANLNLNFHF